MYSLQWISWAKEAPQLSRRTLCFHATIQPLYLMGVLFAWTITSAMPLKFVDLDTIYLLMNDFIDAISGSGEIIRQGSWWQILRNVFASIERRFRYREY
jgi:hypothetical protein